MKKFLLLTAALALMLFSACSEVGNPLSSTGENTAVEAYVYPTIEEGSSELPAGTQMIAMYDEADALDVRGCRPVSYSLFVRAQFGATLNNGRGVKVIIEPNEMPWDATITISNPLSCYAIYDFYPHPFQFNDFVEIKWYLSQFILPEGITWDDLQCWYLNDNGQFEEVSWEFSQNGQFFYLWTNHFSRYIITRPAGG